MPDFNWIIKMAFRDFRKNISRLLLFVSSIVVGIAALVAISSFGENLTKDIDNQAKELLGADLVLENRNPIGDQPIDSLAIQTAAEVNFASMVAFPKTGASRLTQVRALEGAFPFYGVLETIPLDGESNFRTAGKKALVEKTLMAQFNAQVGDQIKVGEVEFEIVGELQKVPGQTGITATVAPAVYIPMAYLEETGLVQYGSRVEYNRYFQFADGTDVEKLIEPYQEQWEIDRVDADTVEDRKRSTGRSFGNLSNFLSLVAFIALLLGCVGVASAVNVFVKEKLASVAVLRCLGVSSRDVLFIYLTEIKIMGLVGAILGAVLGTLLQFILPAVFADFLPVEVTFGISWMSVGFGVLTGLFVSVLFALLPLLKVRNVSPMATLRPETADSTLLKDPLRWMVIVGILLFVWGFSFYLLGSMMMALGFAAFVVFAFGILWGIGQLIMWAVRKFLPISLRYTVRQALANLYRPNNQTISLIATIGLGTAMISTLFFLQNQLLAEAKFADKEDQPNMLMFDIQTAQLDDVKGKLLDRNLRIMQEVPIVTMQLNEINGIDKKENEELPEEEDYSRWLYNREFRVTYRDTLISSETLTDGELIPVGAKGDSIFVSFEKGFAEGNGLKIGDEVEFNVQGRPIKTYIGSLRDVKFNQVSTNFLVLFPGGVLDQAPKFHVLITKTKNDREAADVQAEVVRAFPNISVINLGTIVETLEDILGKISFVIQFMAFFSIATGILVLISSLIISKYQRMRESILLRTLGADSGTVSKINTLEYFFLGSLASLSGILLSFLATWLLSAFVFEMEFRPAWGAGLILYLAITGLTIVLGWLNGRRIINQPPMEILRGNG
ncbi:ABC transporter permease [Algoriphagus zhangzhouensis]|uniref:Putative ABC transport system permease protein n=1 Tax=Algoriphagus zhangzhouensis TaxID=1073327 RepID=A0A1M7ZEY7_9BACT|nr:FtsX-like permease family protein [Algoriphagus zhangzhouensis]TDY46152.1 putative ABC transport system permease protein [Algoriphagus zhangzhouensis]SHO63447.1 putative ABC transport system permease protein [Algoriphagus zhangzhouensis]